MRLRVILSEAWRNLCLNASRTAALALATTLITVLAASLTAQTTLQLIDKSRAFQNAGASTFIASAPSAIDGRLCDSLRVNASVNEAGALRPAKMTIRSLAAPSFTIPAFEVTPGLLSLLGVSPTASGVVLSSQVADQLGVRTGDTVALHDGSNPTVAGIYNFPEDGRTSTLAFAVLIPVNLDGAFDSCWAQVWPITDSTRKLPLLAGFKVQDQSTDLTQLNSKLGNDFSGEADFHNRMTQWSPEFVLFAIAAIFALSVFLRRVVIASDLHAGVRRVDVVSILLFEGVVTVLPSLSALLVLDATLLRPVARSDISTLFVEQAMIAVAVIAGMIMGTVFGSTFTRETRLFSYFKRR